ncbi:uncharacterized protein LY79DRAFT_671564 [Colletotrichum navitas]|uniref:Peroxidase n=1 Tax=Colletotrichum navitas TaxID=681940 RepID=A0AAD8V2E3_9PEZI|nr:uncharacterized protein LY79DRAFT_671564 [Colletotrichum navitas]KAK1584812.1 hypothetical protein LY79DRAFT_671564 [Colletotrichum navitas]
MQMQPGGPKIYFLVGRKDSSVPSAEGVLPTQDSDAATQISAFKNKGFSATDLSLQELSLDSTPEELDSTLFYPETLEETTPTS